MRNLSKNALAVIAVLFFTTVAFSILLASQDSTAREISIGEVAAHVAGGAVERITVSGDDLTLLLKDGTRATAQKEAGIGLSETFRNYGVATSALQGVILSVEKPGGAGYWMGIMIPVLLPTLIMIAIFWWIFRQARSGANQAFSFGKANMKLFAPARDTVTFKDVAGLKESKEEMEEVVDFLKHPKKFLAMGARIPRGVLLMGPPGTGKTLLARATAGESNVPFFHMSASEFVEMFVGVGASRVRDLFQTAKKAAPAIVFIDEIDAVGRERGAGLGGGHDEREQTLNQILVEMDGFEQIGRAHV